MKRVNNKVYTDAEWKRNQVSIYVSGWLLIWGFIFIAYFIG